MAASSPEERVALTRSAWEAYNAGDLDRVLYITVFGDVDSALAAAREREGIEP